VSSQYWCIALVHWKFKRLYTKKRTPVLGMKVKQRKSVIGLFLKIRQWITTSMESSRRDLIVDRLILKMTKFDWPLSLFITVPKTGVGLPESEVSFWSASSLLACFVSCRQERRGSGVRQNVLNRTVAKLVAAYWYFSAVDCCRKEVSCIRLCDIRSKWWRRQREPSLP